MELSLNWLGDHVDLDGLDPGEIAARLTLATAEIEGFEVVENAGSHAVVGEIVRVGPADGGPSALSEVEVYCGDRSYVTLTGAPGIREGLLAAFAPPGAQLPGGLVGESAGASRRSEGMLCSPRELGLGNVADELLLCPAGAEPGRRLSDWIPGRDVLIEVDNKTVTHRPDLWGHYGFARELAAIFGRELQPLATADASAWGALPPVPVALESPDCICFACIALDVDDNAVSPLPLQARLLVLGQPTFGILVDVTNYVALELGQPTHMYDRGDVESFRVAPMGKQSAFVTLDNQERRLEPEDLTIWSRSGPVAIAGIMGGRGTAVTPSTRRTMLESANFSASRVRRTAVRLGLRTQASQRFEKSQPPANTVVAIRRIVELLDTAGAAPRAVSRLTVEGRLGDRPRPVTVPADYVSQVAGAAVPDDRVTSILRSLGFGADFRGDVLAVEVPPFRSEQDVSLPADIVEEVLRIHGYDAIVPQAPAAVLEPTPFALDVRREHKARRILAEAHAATEVQTYAWYDDGWLASIEHEPTATLRLRNPPAPEYSRLRTSLIPNLLKVAHDAASSHEKLRVFEVGRVFAPTEDGSDERALLAGVSVRPDRDDDLETFYREVKGALEDLAQAVAGGFLRAREPDDARARASWHVPGLWAELDVGGRTVGALGALHGRILRAVAPQRQVVWFELEFDALTGTLYPNASYASLPVYPGSQQDFSLVWPVARGYAALETTLDGFAHPFVVSREFVSVYGGKSLAEGTKSYTFRYWLQRGDATLSPDDLESFRGEFLHFLNARGISLR